MDERWVRVLRLHGWVGATLQSLGCDQGQGYLFARPVSADRVPELLASLGADERNGSPSWLG